MGLPLKDIRAKAVEVARASLGQKAVHDALVDTGTDANGESVVFVRIVLADKLDLDGTLEITYTLFTQLADFMQAQGDYRRLTLSYVRKRELKYLQDRDD